MTPRQLLGQARVHTFEYVPYLASYIYSLREQETPGIGTAAVDDAGNLYWDPAFVTQVGKEQTAYLVAHEVLHLIFDHHARSKDIIGQTPSEFQRFVCNVAGDLVIEQTGSTGGIEYLPLPQDDPVRRQPDITRAKEVLGWEPTIPLAEGLQRTIEYFRSSLA